MIKTIDEDVAKFFSIKTVSRLLALALLAVIFSYFLYCFQPDVSRQEMQLDSLKGQIKFVAATGWIFLLLWLVSFFRFWIGGIVLNIVLLPSVFFAYLGIRFRLSCTYGFIVDVVQTNWQESKEFIDVFSVSFFILSIAGMFLVAFVAKKISPTDFLRKKLFCAVLLFLLLLFCVIPSLAFRIAGIRSFAVPIKNLCEFFEYDYVVLKALKKVENEEANFPAESDSSPNPPIVFLHLGESVRADHAPFNGYKRNTMPRVEKEFEAGNVVSFPRCVSFSTSTRLSVIGILTPSRVTDSVVRHGTFIPHLNKKGINTSAFFSSVAKGGGYYDSSLMIATEHVKNRQFFGGWSDTIFEPVSKTIATESANPLFFLYYGEGAHVPAAAYNREKYSVFKPTASDYVEDERRVNNYDNCIVATDDFIGNAIEALRDKNAVYIYVADHGEMLGEDDYWSRNSEVYRRNETRHVLFFIWCSEKFKQENKEWYETLLRNQKRLETVSHDFIYHSILHLYGIRVPWFDAKCDLFSDEAEAFPSELPAKTEFGPMRFEKMSVKWNAPVESEGIKRLEDRKARLREKSKESK